MRNKIKVAKSVFISPTKREELKNWVPESFRIGTWAHCFYCGEIPNCRDHVIPYSMLYPDKYHDGNSPGMTAIACTECNTLLSDSFFLSMMDRCEFVNARLRRKYSKLLKMAVWELWEIRQISGSIRAHVVDKQRERDIAVRRVCWQNTDQFQQVFEDAAKLAAEMHPSNHQLREFISPAWIQIGKPKQ